MTPNKQSRRKMKMLIAMMMVLFVAACGKVEQTLNISVDQRLSAQEQQYIGSGVLRIIKACPGIVAHWGDVTQTETQIMNAENYSESRDYGWEKFVELRLYINNRPRSIPGNYFASGHTCYIRAGNGGRAGVSVVKRACVSVCQDSATRNRDIFIDG